MISSDESVDCAVEAVKETYEMRKAYPDNLWYNDFKFASRAFLHKLQIRLDRIPRIHRAVAYGTAYGAYPQIMRVYLLPGDWPIHRYRACHVELSELHKRENAAKEVVVKKRKNK